MSDAFNGPPEEVFAVDMIVTIQNVETLLFAFAPDVATYAEKHPVLVEPESLDKRENEIWRLSPVHTADGSLYWTILNQKTKKYAWDSVNPDAGEPVFLSSDEKFWKIEHVLEKHYRITPRGRKQDIVDWTDREPREGSRVTLEPRTDSKNEHWIIRGGKASDS